jgi:hypothetical protein
LVVALAGATVCEGVTALCLGDVEDGVGDDRARQRRPERVALVGRVRTHGVETEVRELVFRVDDVQIQPVGVCGLLCLLELRLRLPDVDGDADHFVVSILLLQQRHAHRGVEPAGERECHACHISESDALPYKLHGFNFRNKIAAMPVRTLVACRYLRCDVEVRYWWA